MMGGESIRKAGLDNAWTKGSLPEWAAPEEAQRVADGVARPGHDHGAHAGGAPGTAHRPLELGLGRDLKALAEEWTQRGGRALRVPAALGGGRGRLREDRLLRPVEEGG